MATAPLGTNGRRVALVAGVRTPFARSGTILKDFSAIELGKLCVAELLQRAELDGKDVQAVVYGTVVPNVIAPNIAR
jgi:acetyl-CoA acyltransferase